MTFFLPSKRAIPNTLASLLLVVGTLVLPWWTLHETPDESKILTIPSSLTSNTAIAGSTVIPAILLPHGDFALDPSLVDDFDDETRRAAYEVYRGSSRAAAYFLESIRFNLREGISPTSIATVTTILLVTPHGSIQLDHNFGLYIADSASGTATIGQDLVHRNPKKEYNISISNLPLNFAASLDLLEFLQNRNQSVSGIYPPNQAVLPLNWGEIIPLTILQNQQKKQAKASNSKTQQREIINYMILSMPHRRYDLASEMVPELLTLGEWVGDWMLLQQKQYHKQQFFSVLISGDLSHTHQASGPYGYSTASAAFDRALGDWALDPYGHADSLLLTARRLQPRALSCGFTGHVLWHGILQSQWKRNGTIDVTTKPGVSTPSRILRGLKGEDFRRDDAKYRTVVGAVGEKNGESRHAKDRWLHSKVYVNRNVTYYGMMAATFLWEDYP